MDIDSQLDKKLIVKLRFQLENVKMNFLRDYVINRSKTHTCMDGDKEGVEALAAWNRIMNDA